MLYKCNFFTCAFSKECINAGESFSVPLCVCVCVCVLTRSGVILDFVRVLPQGYFCCFPDCPRQNLMRFRPVAWPTSSTTSSATHHFHNQTLFLVHQINGDVSMTGEPDSSLLQDVLRWLCISVQLIALLNEASAGRVLYRCIQERVIASHDALLEWFVA